MSFPSQVRVFEMSPRDGLQNEPGELITTAVKIELINRLSACGLSHIEAASFVSPKWVPQMGDASEVMAGITRKAGVTYAALTPNLKGVESAFAAEVDEIAVFSAASEAFTQKISTVPLQKAWHVLSQSWKRLEMKASRSGGMYPP